MDNCWTNDNVKYVTCCGNKPEIKIKITPIVKQKIQLLLKKYPNTEWLGYLISDDNDKYKIIDFIIPKQTASSVDVKVDEIVSTPITGIIHSHHNMALKFSGQDESGIHKNHDISILVTHKGMIADVRVKLPCNSFIRIDAKVCIDYKTNLDFENFLSDCDKLIKVSNFNTSINSINYNNKNNYKLIKHQNHILFPKEKNKNIIKDDLEDEINNKLITITEKISFFDSLEFVKEDNDLYNDLMYIKFTFNEIKKDDDLVSKNLMLDNLIEEVEEFSENFSIGNFQNIN